MAWRWKHGVATLVPPMQHSHKLLLSAGYNTDNLIEVPQLSPFDSYRTLGAYLSPSGDTAVACSILHQKVLTYVAKLHAAFLPKETAFWSYLLYLQPQLTFPLYAMTFTEAQCNCIQSPAMMALLPKLHLNRHTTRSIVYGPVRYGGLDLPHLYSRQGLGQLKFLIGHLRAQDKTCKLILICHG